MQDLLLLSMNIEPTLAFTTQRYNIRNALHSLSEIVDMLRERDAAIPALSSAA